MASSEDFQTAGICGGAWWNPGRRTPFPPLSDFMWSSSTMEEYEQADAAAATYSRSDESEDHHSSSSAEHLMVSSSGHAQFFQKPHRMADAGVSDWSQNINHDAFYNLDQLDAPTEVSQTGLESSRASMLPSLAEPGSTDVDYIFDDNFVASVSDFMHHQAGAASDWPKSISPSPTQAPNGGTKRCNNPASFWDSWMGSEETGTPESHQLLLAPASFENPKPYTGANSFNSRGSSATLKSAADHTKDDITSHRLADDSTPLGTDKRKSPTTSSDEAYKRPRIHTPSSLPTFKVRKEKLGDRITALQQLVSPFGKTDTASVLHEAIEYIKFLHDQVLTTPYLQNGTPTCQHQQQMQGESKTAAVQGPGRDLRSRGLCLVPISITFPVVDEATADFWTPTFVGTMSIF